MDAHTSATKAADIDVANSTGSHSVHVEEIDIPSASESKMNLREA